MAFRPPRLAYGGMTHAPSCRLRLFAANYRLGRRRIHTPPVEVAVMPLTFSDKLFSQVKPNDFYREIA